MTEVDVLLELERKLNAHAAEHAGCHEYAEACATHVENAEAQPDKMAHNRCAHTRLHAPPHVPPPHEPLRAPTRPHGPLRAPARSHPPPPASARPCVPMRAPTRPHAPPWVPAV